MCRQCVLSPIRGEDIVGIVECTAVDIHTHTIDSVVVEFVGCQFRLVVYQYHIASGMCLHAESVVEQRVADE